MGARGAAMNWLERMEARFGRWAIPGLIRIVVVLNALVFVLVQFNPRFLDALTLDMKRVMAGQLWRLVSYVFIPPTMSLFWLFFALYLLYLYGEGLERAWGAFRLTVFYLLGMAGTTLAAAISGGAVGNLYLNASVLFAFASLYPNFQLLLFFVLPIEIKWIAWLAAGLFLHQALLGSFADRLAVAAAFLNYAVFFVPGVWTAWRSKSRVAARRRRFERPRPDPDEQETSLHRCAVCGRTEIDSPEEDFRVATDGRDYCSACRARRMRG